MGMHFPLPHGCVTQEQCPMFRQQLSQEENTGEDGKSLKTIVQKLRLRMEEVEGGNGESLSNSGPY